MDEKQSKTKKPFVSRFSKLDNVTEPFEPERYEELVEEGYSNSYIAGELNIDEEFLNNMKRDMETETDEE